MMIMITCGIGYMVGAENVIDLRKLDDIYIYIYI